MSERYNDDAVPALIRVAKAFPAENFTRHFEVVGKEAYDCPVLLCKVADFTAWRDQLNYALEDLEVKP